MPKGDAVTFVQETENLGFMEAVERPGARGRDGDAGRDPQAADTADRRTGLLAEVMEAAVAVFRLQLETAARRRGARLSRRAAGCPRRACDRFEIGFAPDSRQGAVRRT